MIPALGIVIRHPTSTKTSPFSLLPFSVSISSSAISLLPMATPNPMDTTYSSPPPAVSKQTYTIAGIRTTVYGLEELPKEVKNVACLWLLHPRLQTQECMAPIAATTTTEWNKRLQNGQDKGRSTGLIAVSFDQRNHGTREVDNLANEAWRSGNASHAQDMFSIYRASRHRGNPSPC